MKIKHGKGSDQADKEKNVSAGITNNFNGLVQADIKKGKKSSTC